MPMVFNNIATGHNTLVVARRAAAMMMQPSPLCVGTRLNAPCTVSWEILAADIFVGQIAHKYDFIESLTHIIFTL